MPLVDQDVLLDRFGATTPGRLARVLERNGIAFFRGARGRITTTDTAIEAALGINRKMNKDAGLTEFKQSFEVY